MTRTTFRVIDSWTGETVGRAYGPLSKGRAVRFALQLDYQHNFKGRFSVITA